VAAVAEKERFAGELGRWPADAAGWDEVRARIRPLLRVFSEVETALTQAGIPDRPGYLGVDQPTLEATFRYATRLRARYTVIDLLEGQGMLAQAIGATLG
jgi:hypothetical protein